MTNNMYTVVNEMSRRVLRARIVARLTVPGFANTLTNKLMTIAYFLKDIQKLTNSVRRSLVQFTFTTILLKIISKTLQFIRFINKN